MRYYRDSHLYQKSIINEQENSKKFKMFEENFHCIINELFASRNIVQLPNETIYAISASPA